MSNGVGSSQEFDFSEATTSTIARRPDNIARWAREMGNERFNMEGWRPGSQTPREYREILANKQKRT